MKRSLILIFVSIYFILPQSFTYSFTKGEQIHRMFYGISFGFNNTYHDTSMELFPYNLGSYPGNGYSSGYYYGLNCELFIGKFETSDKSIIFKVSYNSLPTEFNFTQGEKVITENNEEYVIIWEHNQEARFELLSFDLLYKYIPFKSIPLGITIGPSINYSLKLDRTHSIHITSPNEAYFDIDESDEYYIVTNNGRTIIPYEKNGEMKNLKKLFFNVKFGLQYEFWGTSDFGFVPNINFNIFPSRINVPEDWYINAIQIGLDIKFSLD